MKIDLKDYIEGREDLFTITNVREAEDALTKFLEWHKEAINYSQCCESDSEQLRSSCDWCNGKNHVNDLGSSFKV